MEQDRPGRDVAAAEVWVEVEAEEGAGAEWVAHLLQGRADIVCARVAARRRRTLLVHRVIEELVPSAGR